MSASLPLTWDRLPAPLRTLARWLTIVQAVAYTVALGFVYHTTRLTPGGAAARYRGSDPAAAESVMQFPKSLAEMLTITHTHLLSMAAIFAFSGACLALCRRPGERIRSLLIAEPFAALLVSFSAMWLMRYADPRFAWLLVASSSLMAATFYVQAFLILRELARLPEERP
jgi:hypothetical protein